MVRMTVLASGSRGNSTVVSSSRTRVLIDAGLSCRELFRRMHAAGEDPHTLDAILVTHEHQDHVQGLSVLARKLGIPVFFTEATHRAWVRWMTPRKRLTYADWLVQRKAEQAAANAPATSSAFVAQEPLAAAALEAAPATDLGYREAELLACQQEEAELAAEVLEADAAACLETAPKAKTDPAQLPAVEFFRSGTKFCVGDIEITPFTIPHDAADPVGFVLCAEGLRIALATDLGYMPPNVAQQLRRADILMLESNHDLEMLRDGPYPWSVKQRVLSRVGHLSNAAAADFLERGYDGDAAYVVLAHLSESNNMPELARLAAEHALRDRMKLIANKLVLAAQHEPTPSLCL